MVPQPSGKASDCNSLSAGSTPAGTSIKKNKKNACNNSNCLLLYSSTRPQLNWIERQTTDLKVAGSIPTGRAIKIYIRDVAQLGSASGLGPEGRRFESCHLDHLNGVLAQLVEHLLCTQGVRSSNLLSSTIYIVYYNLVKFSCIGGVAQLVRAIGSYPIGRGFESPRRHQIYYS